jgi:hypothetical protein
VFDDADPYEYDAPLPIALNPTSLPMFHRTRRPWLVAFRFSGRKRHTNPYYVCANTVIWPAAAAAFRSGRSGGVGLANLGITALARTTS